MATGSLSIKLKCASWPQLATIYKRDLMRGAMFLKATSPPVIGTLVRIDLTLPSGSVIVLTGAVEQHVTDAQRGSGVELKLAPIPAGTIWMIESALAAEAGKRPRAQSPATSGVPAAPLPLTQSGPVAAIGAGEDLAAAETDLVRALVAEAESLKKLNPFLVLGIGYEANDNDVRAAFGELTKRYHPDRFARYESTELRNVAAEIFILIRDAYRRICDDSVRTHVLASLGRASAAPRAIPTPAAMRSTPPGGLPRVGGPKPASNQIPVTRVPDKTTPLPMHTTSGPTTRVQEQTTKKPEPLPDPRQGNDDTTKKPVPLPSEKRPTATTPPPQSTRSITGSPMPVSDNPEHGALDEMIDSGRYDEALAAYKMLSKRNPNDRVARAGIELCEGLAALAQRDRLEAAQRFEAALEIDPSNERAARELAEMRRQATNERKGLLSRLMGKSGSGKE